MARSAGAEAVFFSLELFHSGQSSKHYRDIIGILELI
jgi:hypothetical protein